MNGGNVVLSDADTEAEMIYTLLSELVFIDELNASDTLQFFYFPGNISLLLRMLPGISSQEERHMH